MTWWWVILCVWIGLSVLVALFIGRMIRLADRDSLDCDGRERDDESAATDLPAPRDHGEAM